MTLRLEQEDSYLREFEASVLSVQGDSVQLDQSAFYPGGGGQPADRGTLETGGSIWQVTGLKSGPDGIWHQVGDAGPAAGTHLVGRLDWERRHQLMRTHTAMHVLCGVVWRDYGAQVTGGNMEPLKGRMDFEFPRLTQDLVQEIEAKVQLEILTDRPVRTRVLPRAEAFEIPDLIRTKVNLLPPTLLEIRTVEIVGLDLQADGGTHVRSTREVGRVRIVDYKSKGAANKRLVLVVEDLET